MIALNGSFLFRGSKASLYCALLFFLFVSDWSLADSQIVSEKQLRSRAQFFTSDVPVSFPERLVVTPSGKAFLLDTDLSTLFTLDKSGKLKRMCGSESLASPSDISVDARKITRKFDRPELQAKVLIELTNKALSNRDTSLATELLSEASDVTSKAQATPDKAILLLNIAQQFGRFDTIRGFETLGDALKLINQLKPEEAPVRSVVAKSRPLRIKTYTVLNGNEFSASDRATLESINFSQLGSFVAEDYTQTRLLGNKLEQPLWRTKFLTAVASAMLLTSQTRPASRLTSSN